MAAKLIVTKEDGTQLFDTTKIAYGLVKSGYMSYAERWLRYTKPFVNTDPDKGSSWQPDRAGDEIHQFSVSGAKSPIVFLVGRGTLTGASVSGSTTTFFYTNASASTKCYCFDLMTDSIPGGPYLKTFREDGVLTFNSLQRPLNVIAAISSPPIGPAVGDGYGGVTNAYVGGWSEQSSDRNIPQAAGYLCGIDISVGAEEYAAHLPWSRGAGCRFVFRTGGPTSFGVVEGAYGRAGGISFMFGPAGATTNGSFSFGTGFRAAPRWDNVPTDRLPSALVIRTAEYPFPYG